MKKVIGITLFLSVLANMVLLYRVFDMGVTATYGADEFDRRNKQAADMEKLLPLLMLSATRADVLSAAQKVNLEVLNKSDEGLYVGEIHFVFSGDQVAAVKFE